jgi:hypothetical protein
VLCGPACRGYGRREGGGNASIVPLTPGIGTGLEGSQPQTARRAPDEAPGELMPDGGIPPKLSTGQRQQFLAYAQCLRTHGAPSFPDPVFSGGGVRIGGPGIAFDSPAVKAAVKACRSKLPSKGGFGAA